MFLRLDALGNQPAAGRPGEVAHAVDERLAGEVGVDPADQADVQLHEVGPQLHDVAEVGDAGPRVVDGEAHDLVFNEEVIAAWGLHRQEIEKAAAAYYRKSARELTLGEAATLAGLLRAPATYSPINHPEAAADRAKLVIAAMAEMGVITKKEAESALSASGEIAASNYVPSTRYVVDWLNEQLPDLIKHYSQSIIIETTIDAKLQSFAERALRKRLNEEGKKLAASEGALVILDTTGAVKAMVGGKSYRRSQLDRKSVV